jgi:hypothetical protein
MVATMSDDDAVVLGEAIAAAGDRPKAAAVVTALLQMEKRHRHDRCGFPVAQLMGNWRLHFSSRGKVKLGDALRGFYLPSWVPAQIGFQPSGGEDAPIVITNQIAIGVVSLKLSGPARFSEKVNLLAFDFTQIEVKVLGRVLYSGRFPSPREGKVFMDLAIGKLPFFAFFAVDDRFIAARGRGGGLAIWVKDEVG